MKNLLLLLIAFIPNLLFAQLVSDFQVNDPDTAARDDFEGRIDVDGEGNYVIAWTDRRTGRPNVFCQMYNSNSVRIGNNFRVNNIPDSSSSPDIAVNRNGKFGICWYQSTNFQTHLNLKLYDKQGDPITNEIILNDSTNGIHGDPRIDINSLGEYIITWDYRPNTSTFQTIYYQVVDSNGNKIGTNRIADDQTPVRKDNPSINVFPDNRFVITWQDRRVTNVEDIYYQMFDGDGNKIGGNTRVYDDTLSNAQTFPLASSDSLNRFCICFTEFDLSGPVFRIRGQPFNSDGSRDGTDFVVAPFSLDQYLRAIEKRSDGKMVVAFDKGFMNNVPYFQRLDSSGNEIGGEYAVSIEAQNFNKNYTDVAVYGDKIISVWDDSRNGNSDVFCNVRSFTNPDSTVGISQIWNELPSDYRLYQNYPNPFNPMTKIKYSIPQEGLVKLKIYDMAGREIISLVNEIKEAGSYEIVFNGNALSSGVYFYKIEVGSFKETKKMILLK